MEAPMSMTEPSNARALRQQSLLDHVMRAGSATSAELANSASCSLMTIHRDLDDLASRGLVRKFHGGVSALPTSVFESSSAFRIQRSNVAKEKLAREAIKFIEPGMSIMLDDSTTVLSLARLLKNLGHITVITNYRPSIEILSESPDVRLIILGGTYSRTHDSFIGIPSVTGIENYAVDAVFLSTSTMHEGVTYHQEHEVVLMKRAMLNAGNRKFLLLDESKIGRTSLNRFVSASEFTDVVLTDGTSSDVVAKLREVTTVHIAR
jgi:DeoR/GlpR family transcriptional regulator of sugar metabolism